MMNPLAEPALESALLTQLKKASGQSTPQPKAWAKSVQMLSNHYVAEPDSISPWSKPWAREALLSYFHPLNQARAERVATKGAELGFFDDIEHLVDLGCGSAAASLGFLQALQKHSGRPFRSLELVDHSREITEIAKALVEETMTARRPPDLRATHHPLETFKSDAVRPGTLLLLSYVLTEAHSAAALERLVHRLPGLEALAILEPSTSVDARRLQALRPVLMKLGFHLWAPCTHSEECPLLKDSDRDWCHDRLIPAVPSWWSELEAELPMKNKTVTVSYLLARRKPRAKTERGEVRVIGDRLDEKTKVRQMVCRGPNREFISWFPSRLKGEAEDFHLERGDRFETSPELWKDQRGVERSHEYRLDLEAIRHIEKTRRSSNKLP